LHLASIDATAAYQNVGTKQALCAMFDQQGHQPALHAVAEALLHTFFCVMNTTQSLPRTPMDVTPDCRTALNAYSAVKAAAAVLLAYVMPLMTAAQKPRMHRRWQCTQVPLTAMLLSSL
jgi:hypothetical protein